MSMKRPLKIDDLERLTLVSDPKISKDERKTIYTVTKPSIKEDKYFSTIWILDNLSYEYDQITMGPTDNSPEWSPDSKRISFLSRRTFKEEEKGMELWILNIEKMYEPRLLIKLNKPISNIRWNPDGSKILFISQTGEVEEDVKIIEDIPIWFNGRGFTYNLRDHLFIVDVSSGNISQVTEGDRNILYAEWSNDGKKIAYISSEYKLKPYITDIHVLNLKSGEDIKITKSNMDIWDLTWSPDDKYIGFRGHDLSWGLITQPKIWIINSDGSEPRLLTDIDRDLMNAMNSDVRGVSSGKAIQWVGKYIYFPLSDGGTVSLYRVDLNGDIEPVIRGGFTVEDYSVSSNLIMLTLMSSIEPPEIYIYKNGMLNKVSDYNRSLLDEVNLNKHEHFRFKASDGEYIDGWVLKPYGFKKDEKYPAILYIHGGPATAYGESFMYEFHVLSGEGFIVIYTNPRGSVGYTQKFKDLRGKYGERDYRDLIESVKFIISKYDYIDKDRIGVTGGSYGGFMTNWIIGHTDMFKAAVTQRSISNWISDYGTTDIGFYFNEDQIAGGFDRPFWDEKWFNKYWDQSPIKYIGNVSTPTLIIHSIEDYRCWMDQALQLFTALKKRGVPVKLVLFPKEDHDLSRRGKPKHRVKRLEEIIKWFTEYLKKME